MNWQQLEIICNKAYAENLSDFLLEAGAVSSTIEAANQSEILFEFEPGKESGVWHLNKIISLFEESFDCLPVLQEIKKNYTENIIQHMELTILPDQNWHENWMENFEPVQISKKLWICPSWQEPKDSTAINIILDPGMAFGTGTHPTTAMCLRWLEKNIQGGETLIDFGCGSGILAIAAVKLGCKKVIAIDIDPQALVVTKENAEKNHVSPEQLTTLLAPIENIEPTNLVVANILANPLIELAPLIHSMTKENGKIALSGLLKQQASDVKNAYTQWFNIQEFEEVDGWVCLSSKR